MVRHFARLDGLDEEEVDHLTLVVSELLSNAVDHGGGEAAMEREEAATTMRLLLELGTGYWRLEVSDQGGGDPATIEPLLHEDALEAALDDERGRGFFLMRQMVDRLEVVRSDDGLGLCVRVLRRHGDPSD
jgi:anti-sigma regulatory factor (Ser/Thr protein kinase)